MPGSSPAGSREWGKTLSEGIVDALRKAILDGALEPGCRLVETELATTYQVSRGPLREALRVLEREGLVKYLPRRGTYVASLSTRDWQEVYSMRLLLERFNYGLVVQDIRPEDIAHLQAFVDEMNVAGHKGDIATLVAIDMKFHDYLIDRGGHHRLAEIWHNLSHLVGAVFLFAMRSGGISSQEVHRRHQGIVDAFASRDVEVVRKALSDHYFVDPSEGDYALPSVHPAETGPWPAG